MKEASGQHLVSEQKTILFVTTVAATAQAFLVPYADHMRGLGWKVSLASSELPSGPALGSHFEELFEIGWRRTPRAIIANLRALVTMRDLLAGGRFILVHVHTPIAATITRMACALVPFRRRPVIIYTAHGFHFHRKGSALNNLLFSLIEKMAGRLTDWLVVINDEDAAAADKLKLTMQGRTIEMKGIGIDLERFDRAGITDDDKRRVRHGINVPTEAPLAIMIAEFNPGKRHRDLLGAVAKMRNRVIHLVFAGTGPLMGDIRELAAQIGILERCRFLGHVDDIPLLLAASDIMVLPSEREGLPRAVMEAMAMGVPVIGANARGIRDLLSNGCGILHEIGNVEEIAGSLDRLLADQKLAQVIRERARLKILGYDIRPLLQAHAVLYQLASQLRNHVAVQPTHSMPEWPQS